MMLHERKYLEFVGRQQDLGLNGRFNTFRRGTKWLKTLQIGEVVGLHVVDKEAGFEGDIGVAVVGELESGPLGLLLKYHTDFNHDVSHATRASPDALREILFHVYGPDAVGNDEVYTVVYLTRILLTPADDLLLELTARMHQQDEADLEHRDVLLDIAAHAVRIVRFNDIGAEQLMLDKVG